MVRDFSTQGIGRETKICSPVLIVGFYSDRLVERRSRLDAVFAMAEKLPDAHVLFVGGWRPDAKVKIGAKRMAADFAKLGISIDRISTDTDSNDTISNIESVKAHIKINPVCTLVLVSSPSHIVRMRFFVESLRQQADVLLLSNLHNTKRWAQFRALHYEMVAYIVSVLPRGWVKPWIDRYRQSELLHYEELLNPVGQMSVI